MYSWNLVLGVILSVTGYVISRSVPISQCEHLYKYALILREDFLNSPTMNSLMPDAVNYYKELVEENLDISIKDNVALKNIICRITDAATNKDLADTLHVSEVELEYIISVLEEKYVVIKREIPGLEKQFTIYGNWAKKSGFPSTWPLTVTLEKTREFLENIPLLGSKQLWYFEYLNKTELAEKLTDAASLQDFLHSIQIGAEGERLNMYLNIYTLVANESSQRDINKAVLSIKNAIGAVKEIGVFELK